MIIKNQTIKNENIHFKDVNLDFSQTGVYIVNGENGVGKTTLLENILYDQITDITFKSSEHQAKYPDHKHELFSYLPQNLPQPKVTVKEYLKQGNVKLNDSKRQLYFTAFELEDKLLKSKFSDLSGGEQVKIAFIVALLKETPFLFLDEPTNNLDNKSVFKHYLVFKKLK